MAIMVTRSNSMLCGFCASLINLAPWLSSSLFSRRDMGEGRQ